MTKTIFVTGTDTGIGKTRIAAALLHALVARGFCSAAFKPVAAGADAIDSESGAPCNGDALILQREANAGQTYAQVNPVLLEAPVAPHIAAANSSVNIAICDLQEAAREAQASCDYLVVEGAGGWLVPVNRSQTLADLAVALQAKVLLVVGMRLGCLNHALLSAAAIRASGCELAGWVANTVDPAMPERDANIAALEERLQAPLLGTLDWEPRATVAACARMLDIEPLRG